MYYWVCRLCNKHFKCIDGCKNQSSHKCICNKCYLPESMPECGVEEVTNDKEFVAGIL